MLTDPKWLDAVIERLGDQIWMAEESIAARNRDPLADMSALDHDYEERG